jgi:hypothetical protein
VRTTPWYDCLTIVTGNDEHNPAQKKFRKGLQTFDSTRVRSLGFRIPQPRRVAITNVALATMTTLQPHLDSISATSSALATLPFNTIPTHFIASLLHQSGVDNLIRDPHPHERGLFTVRPPGHREKENIPLGEEGKVIRTRTERERISPLLLPKYSSGANVEADVFLKTADSLLAI